MNETFGDGFDWKLRREFYRWQVFGHDRATLTICSIHVRTIQTKLNTTSSSVRIINQFENSTSFRHTMFWNAGVNILVVGIAMPLLVLGWATIYLSRLKFFEERTTILFVPVLILSLFAIATSTLYYFYQIDLRINAMAAMSAPLHSEESNGDIGQKLVGIGAISSIGIELSLIVAYIFWTIVLHFSKIFVLCWKFLTVLGVIMGFAAGVIEIGTFLKVVPPA